MSALYFHGSSLGPGVEADGGLLHITAGPRLADVLGAVRCRRLGLVFGFCGFRQRCRKLAQLRGAKQNIAAGGWLTLYHKQIDLHVGRGVREVRLCLQRGQRLRHPPEVEIQRDAVVQFFPTRHFSKST